MFFKLSFHSAEWRPLLAGRDALRAVGRRPAARPGVDAAHALRLRAAVLGPPALGGAAPQQLRGALMSRTRAATTTQLER